MLDLSGKEKFAGGLLQSKCTFQGNDGHMYAPFERREMTPAARGYSANSSRSIDSSPVQDGHHMSGLSVDRAHHR